ncbi:MULTISPECIES: C40 family peptidase [unclassified Flavobacterium]|jgi:cell wall-associated NlpC family hydrolase|uniref:C40 family peptidase n=1 Tax=unclassified Flavobacterium TaxID=196869 RepID=UPI0025C00A59|nr:MULTISPECIES: C40 family peptidase [unclassified Flavobacterium]
MTSKKINPVKFASLIGLVIIVLCFIAYGSLKRINSLPENDETIVKKTLINPVKTNVSLRDSIVGFGMELLGKPYAAGGCSRNGFDCSGFVYFVFQHYKIQVPRSSSEFSHFGKEIPIKSVRKGDILVFLSPTRNDIGHVGIVTNPKGKESDFIHASSGSEMKVIITSLKKEGYTRRFVKAVDVISAY